jgi:NADPH-dependent glutamate synthase beta subunit-like oxidoreductase
MDDALPRISVSSGSTLANRTGSWKYIRPQYQDSVAPCNARCPTGTDIEGCLELLRRGRVRDAADLLLRENPMPAVTGRVCHHPCESGCNRASFDEPVAVHLIERFLGDRILAADPEPFRRTRPERIAVVGSGPAGLACAYHLARLGYGVTIFEAAAEAGGMLRLGIPAYRLPRDLLDRQIAWLRASGIGILCNVSVSASDVASLVEGFDAVFVAGGAHQGKPLGIPGEDAPGVRAGLDFLKAVNRGERPDVGRRVVVVGGGNTAMDCARTALRLGADVSVVYRRTRTEMPAIAEEIDAAQREGVAFEFLASPRALHRTDGVLLGLECDRMVLGEPDASGRRRPVTAPDGAFSVPADLILTAIGEDAELAELPADVAVQDGSIVIDEFGATVLPMLWAGGDAAGIDRTVSAALGSGKAAAIGMDAALRVRRGEAHAPDGATDALRWAGGCFSMARWQGADPVRRTAPVNRVAAFDTLNTTHFQHVPRHREPASGTAVPDFSEVNAGLAAETAMAEARRCFNCGVCNECELCLIFCADVAISRNEGGGFTVDLDHCKGCGVCAYECPRGAIVMTREGL